MAAILSEHVNWTAAIIFYLVYIVGILIFAVRPAIQAQSIIKAAILGGLYGFFTYATYDLTNMATIDGWPLRIVIVDILWGTTLCTTVSVISYVIGSRIL